MFEKKIPFEVTEVDLKNKPDWFLEISPYGKVPVIKHDELLVYESAVINEYLDEVFPETPMLPNTPALRARARIWIDFANQRIQPGNLAIIKAAPEDFHAKTQALEDSLALLEEALQQNEQTGLGAPYFFGEHFTLVDATYAPAFERMSVLPHLRDYTIPDRLERVNRWMSVLAGHPSVTPTATPLDNLIANYEHLVPVIVRKSA